MASKATHPLIQYVRKAALAQGEQASDGRLVERFVLRRDEAAFAALVQRHGQMVFGVCRRVLAHAQDAEDAFQATFLVLARKASTVQPREKVGHWLYGVAYRTALEARTTRARRRFKESQAPVRTAEDGGDDPLRELRGELDRQLHGLPEKYRLPVLLCDLQGKTQQEAAQQLGWPEGTVSGRLFRARQLLAHRLKKRGVAVAALALPALLSRVAVAAVPPALTSATVKAVATLAPPALTAAVVSDSVTRLTEGVLRAMFFRRVRFFLAVFVGVALLATAAYPVIQHVLASDQPLQQAQNAGLQNPAPAPDQPPAPKALTAKETFDQLEKKLTGAKTVRCKFEITTKVDNKEATMKGKLVIAEGNKALLELEGDEGGGKMLKLSTVTDGKQVMSIQDGKKSIKAKEGDEIREVMVAALARSGISFPMFYAVSGPGGKEAEKVDPAKLFPVSDLKLGKSETVAGKQATVLHYQLNIKDDKTAIKTTMWLDAKTGLPLKRVLTVNGAFAEFTETYTECTINEAIDPNVFKIPAE